MYRLILLIILLTSCFPKQPNLTTISFNIEINQDIVDGLTPWEKSLNHGVFRIVNKNAEIRVFEVEEFVSKKKRGPRVVGLAGLTKSGVCYIQLKKEKWHPAILTHEIGHCFRLKHDIHDQYSVMNWEVYKTAKIRRRHVRRARRYLNRRKNVQQNTAGKRN